MRHIICTLSLERHPEGLLKDGVSVDFSKQKHKVPQGYFARSAHSRQKQARMGTRLRGLAYALRDDELLFGLIAVNIALKNPSVPRFRT